MKQINNLPDKELKEIVIRMLSWRKEQMNTEEFQQRTRKYRKESFRIEKRND